MKRFFLLPVAAGLLMASCDTTTKDSTSTLQFGEYNLIVSDNPQQPASASPCVYKLDFNLTKGAVAISTENLLFNNINHSFETDTVGYSVGVYKDANGNYFEQGQFSSASNIGRGASVTRLDAKFTGASYYVSVEIPGFTTAQGVATRLVMGYDYDNSWHVQTFWPECFYVGNSIVTGNAGQYFSTSATAYRIAMDMEKLTAQCVVYTPQFDSSDSGVVKAILLSEIPIKFDHSSYYLEADSPKTQIVTQGSMKWDESDAWKATDFKFNITSADLTQGVLTYKISGRDIHFSGSSVASPSFSTAP